MFHKFELHAFKRHPSTRQPVKRHPVKAIKYLVTAFFALVLCIPLCTSVASAKEPDLLGKVIVLDAGHGGRDTGARGATGVYEKNITLAVAKELQVLLVQNGAQVVMTRTIDDDLATERDRLNKRRQRADLQGRLRVARRSHPDLFISIHCNASTSPSWSGAQTLYMRGRENGKQVAAIIQSKFREDLMPTNRTPAAVSSLFLLKHVHTPASLVEIGFLSNPREEQQLNTSAYQKQVAFALYTGILEYFQQAPATWRTQISSLFS